MTQIGKTVKSRLESLKSARQVHEAQWAECYRNAAPHRGQMYVNAYPRNAQDLARQRAKIYDSTPTTAANDMAAGLIAGTTPANAQWFEYAASGDVDFTGKQWLDNASRIVWQNIAASNHDSIVLDCALDYVVGGSFVQLIDEAPLGGFVFECVDVSECYLASSVKGQRLDSLYRPFTMTVSQIVSEYGEDKLTSEMREAFIADKIDTRFELIRAIYPRAAYKQDGPRMADELPFASVTICAKTCEVLRESGYHEQPFAAPRGYIIGSTDFAVGPFYHALADAKQLQELWRWETEAAAVAIGGMWKATDDGVLNPRAVRLGPNKIVAVADINNLVPLTSGARFDVAYQQKNELREAIRRTLMSDVLKPNDAPTMTATETHVRVQLVRQRFGPQLGRLMAEWLQVMLARCFGLALRAGALGDPPDSLQGQTAAIRYKSPLARAQQMEDVSAADQLLQRIQSHAAATQDASLYDNIDERKMLELYANNLGVPPSVLRSADAVEQLRQARSQSQAAAQQQAQAQDLQSQLAVKAA